MGYQIHQRGNMGQNKIIYIIASIVLLLTGYLLAGLLRTSWVFDYTIEPIDIINLIVTIVVSICVAWYITKGLAEERFEKELIISDLKDIEAEIKKIMNAYDGDNPGSVILPAVNQLQILIERFKNSMRITSSKDIDVSVLDSAFRNFYGCATNYESESQVNEIDLPTVQNYGNNLIIEVRNLISTINKK